MSPPPTSHGGPGGREAGFTLIEFLLGLAIVSLTIVALQPVLHAPSADQVLEATARRLAASLRSARLRAIRGNREAVVRIDVRRRSYVSEGIAPRRFLPVGIAVAATASTSSTSASSVAFRFFPDGSASGGNVKLSLGGHSRRLVIDWLSGHVRAAGGGTP